MLSNVIIYIYIYIYIYEGDDRKDLTRRFPVVCMREDYEEILILTCRKKQRMRTSELLNTSKDVWKEEMSDLSVFIRLKFGISFGGPSTFYLGGPEYPSVPLENPLGNL